MKNLRYTAALMLPLMLAATPAFAASWAINPTTSKITFLAHFNNAPVQGTFNSWKGDIQFDPAHLETSHFTITINLASVDTQDASRDDTLRGPDFFNTKFYANAIYTTKSITKTSQGYVATGTLSLAGVSKNLAVPFTVTIVGNAAQAHGMFKLSRGAFGIGKGEWQGASQISDLVDINFTVNATAK